jgi:hypothetical protein
LFLTGKILDSYTKPALKANMKNFCLILSTLSLAFFSNPASGQFLPITMSQIDSLQMPYSLPELIKVYREKQLENDPDVARRIWNITRNYHALQTTRKELKIISVQVSNLKAAWQLKSELAAKGDNTDLDRLDAHNSYLSRRLAFIGKENEARTYLLEIVRLSPLNIVTEKEAGNVQKKETHTAAH